MGADVESIDAQGEEAAKFNGPSRSLMAAATRTLTNRLAPAVPRIAKRSELGRRSSTLWFETHAAQHQNFTLTPP
jgi:hypothetical protein